VTDHAPRHARQVLRPPRAYGPQSASKGGGYVYQAAEIVEGAPELADDVAAGRLKLPVALMEARCRKQGREPRSRGDVLPISPPSASRQKDELSEPSPSLES
jgi:hypothetical protein